MASILEMVPNCWFRITYLSMWMMVCWTLRSMMFPTEYFNLWWSNLRRRRRIRSCYRKRSRWKHKHCSSWNHHFPSLLVHAWRHDVRWVYRGGSGWSKSWFLIPQLFPYHILTGFCCHRRCGCLCCKQLYTLRWFFNSILFSSFKLIYSMGVPYFEMKEMNGKLRTRLELNDGLRIYKPLGHNKTNCEPAAYSHCATNRIHFKKMVVILLLFLPLYLVCVIFCACWMCEACHSSRLLGLLGCVVCECFWSHLPCRWVDESGLTCCVRFEILVVMWYD